MSAHLPQIGREVFFVRAIKQSDMTPSKIYKIWKQTRLPSQKGSLAGLLSQRNGNEHTSLHKKFSTDSSRLSFSLRRCAPKGIHPPLNADAFSPDQKRCMIGAELRTAMKARRGQLLWPTVGLTPP